MAKHLSGLVPITRLLNAALTVPPNPQALQTLTGAPGFDPYAPIEKRPLITHDGMKSKGFTVRIEDDRQNSGWRECGIVREDYLLVPNRDVRDMAEEIAIRSGHDFVTSRTLFDGKRFSLAITFPFAFDIEVRVGDPVSIGMMLENSYDGSKRLSASLFVHRLACSNGMIAPHLFGRIRFRHVQRSSGWEDEVARVMQVIEQADLGLKEFTRLALRLSSHALSTEHLRLLRSGPLASVPLTLWARVMDQWTLREEPTLYGALNAATAVTWHDPKMTVRDVEHNETLTRGLLGYAEHLN